MTRFDYFCIFWLCGTGCWIVFAIAFMTEHVKKMVAEDPVLTLIVAGILSLAAWPYFAFIEIRGWWKSRP